MKLKYWIKKNNLSYREAAKIIQERAKKKVTHCQVHQWATGINKPNIENIKALQIATFGHVTINDFMD